MSQKKQPVGIFSITFTVFEIFTVIFSGDLGFEERIYHVKFFWSDIWPAGYQKRPDIRFNPTHEGIKTVFLTFVVNTKRVTFFGIC